MKQKRVKRYKSKHQRQWKLTIDSKDASENFFSILASLQKSGGGGLIDKEALVDINRWLLFISREDPGVVARTNDNRGPFRKRDVSPLSLSLELDKRQRDLMLFILKTMYKQLASPSMRYQWIQNQGRADYELAIKNYEFWINSLEEKETSSET